MPEFTLCPVCKQKNVFLKLSKRPGDDVYKCRNKKCDFYFYADTTDKIDRDAHEQWEKINAPE